jgi:hypothetical protein
MRPQAHWIDLPIAGQLAIMGRPRTGDWLDDEISVWREEGIGVSMKPHVGAGSEHGSLRGRDTPDPSHSAQAMNSCPCTVILTD